MLDRYVAHKNTQREAKARQKVDLTHPESVASAESRALALKLALALAKRRHDALVSALKPIREHFGALAPVQATAETPHIGISSAYVREYVTKRMDEARKRGDRSNEGVRVVERAGKVGDRTVSIELAYLRAALKRAGEEGEVQKSTLPTIKLPRGAAKARRRTLKRSEFKRLLEKLFGRETPRHLRVYTMLGILTGQRPKTLKAGRWPMIDYETGIIRWTETDPDAADNKRIQDTPMTPDMASWLMEVQAEAESEYLVEFEGGPVASLQSAWRSLLKRAELADVRPHDLRRAAASIALNAGGDIRRIALLLNDDEATTRRNYAHAAPELLLGVVRLIEGEVRAAQEGDGA